MPVVYNSANKHERHLQDLHDKYEAQVTEYAAEVFKAKVLPWLQKKGYSFLSNNGTWWIGYDDPSNKTWGFTTMDADKVWPRRDIPKRIVDLLYSEVPGFPSMDLGCFMPHYHHNGEGKSDCRFCTEE